MPDWFVNNIERVKTARYNYYFKQNYQIHFVAIENLVAKTAIKSFEMLP